MNLNKLLMPKVGAEGASPEWVSEEIRRRIVSGQASMIGRFGSVEIKGVLYPFLPSIVRSAVRAKVFGALRNNAGFFPVSNASVERFSELMLQDMAQLDILGSWRCEERLFERRFQAAKRVVLSSLEPYFCNSPWSSALEGKRVLVVHPFSETIASQYHAKRELLFENKGVLPEFESLRVVRAVQTIAGNESDFSDWFAALEYLKSEVDRLDFDVAIIGCGAYGFPLAAHVKRRGKVAVHLGGATQILFGIKGLRWDCHPIVSRLYNESWVRPNVADVPTGASSVEGGCYW